MKEREEEYKADEANRANGAYEAYGANEAYETHEAYGGYEGYEGYEADGICEVCEPDETYNGHKPLEPQTFLPKKGNYEGLLVYKKATAIFDLTFFFTQHFLSKGDRTIDQMVQAARSGKQNIAEGSAASSTSSETELKLMNVARASMKELLVDYEDYLRVRNLQQWSLQDERAIKTREFCIRHTEAADFMAGIERRSDEAIANITITLLHQFDNMMGKLIDRLQKDCAEKGGIREQMTAARLGYRNDQKARIAELEAENAQLRARIAELEAQKGGGV